MANPIPTGKSAQIIPFPGVNPSLSGRCFSAQDHKRIAELKEDIAFYDQARAEMLKKIDGFQVPLKAELLALGVSDSWKSKEAAR